MLPAASVSVAVRLCGPLASALVVTDQVAAARDGGRPRVRRQKGDDVAGGAGAGDHRGGDAGEVVAHGAGVAGRVQGQRTGRRGPWCRW